MKTLVIDTAFRSGRLGVAIDGRMTVEREVEAGRLESETFVIMMKLGVPPDMSGIDLMALAGGPGSFTGLKIGAVVAKSLSFLQKVPFRGVGTLPWLSVSHGNGILLPCIKSHADKFYWGMYEVNNPADSIGIPKEIMSPRCMNSSGIIETIRKAGVPEPEAVVLFSGDQSGPELPWPGNKTDLPLSILARLAEESFRAEGSDDPLNYTPQYVARSQAEERFKGN